MQATARVNQRVGRTQLLGAECGQRIVLPARSRWPMRRICTSPLRRAQSAA